jgi:hypothetical protein
LFRPGSRSADDFVATNDLIQELNSEKDWPWADWSNGKGITSTKLAQILKPFGVKSRRKTIEVKTSPLTTDERKTSGYYREHLEPVFDRYLPTAPPDPRKMP